MHYISWSNLVLMVNQLNYQLVDLLLIWLTIMTLTLRALF